MKRLFLASTLLTSLTATAFAADLPRRAAPPPVFTPVPVFTWGGFYAGFNAGYGFDARNHSNTPTVIGVTSPTLVTAPGRVTFPGNRDVDGFVGGGQIGYNYQFTPGAGLVVGVEADAQYVDFGRNRNTFTLSTGSNLANGAQLFNPNGIAGLDYFGTVRGRAGYAFDRTLFYATGGFAYGNGGGRRFGVPNTASNDFKTGYAVGGGIEYALPTDSFLNFFHASAVTIKAEGLYVNLEDGNVPNGSYGRNAAGTIFRVPTGGTLISGTVNQNRDNEFAVVRGGLNYKFGSY